MPSAKQQKSDKTDRKKQVEKARSAQSGSSSKKSGTKVHTTLGEEDAYRIADLLSNPPEPGDVLRRAAEVHSKLMR